LRPARIGPCPRISRLTAPAVEMSVRRKMQVWRSVCYLVGCCRSTPEAIIAAW
jgi:hypothetical protein